MTSKVLQRFHFNTGVKPFAFNPPAGMAFMKGFEDSGNGVYVIPFYCENVPKGAMFKEGSNEFKPDTNNSVCRIIYDSAMQSKYAHFII